MIPWRAPSSPLNCKGSRPNEETQALAEVINTYRIRQINPHIVTRLGCPRTALGKVKNTLGPAGRNAICTLSSTFTKETLKFDATREGLACSSDSTTRAVFLAVLWFCKAESGGTHPPRNVRADLFPMQADFVTLSQSTEWALHLKSVPAPPASIEAGGIDGISLSCSKTSFDPFLTK